MDVYVAATGKVRLMDFNPVGGFTSPLLFGWDELGYGTNVVSWCLNPLVSTRRCSNICLFVLTTPCNAHFQHVQVY